MTPALSGRLTARFEGEVVVFLIGMRVNRLWKVHKWLPVARAMPQMLRELRADPESGLLGFESWVGNPTISLQYWRSFEHLERYAKDAWAVSEGQRLYSQMNCAGCHARGGGGAMGPPLMDSEWLYGSGLVDIERTILAGSARGMPAFKDRLTRQQTWQLVAYVRSLGGYAPSSAAPTRDDHMSVRPPPSRTEPQPPRRQVD